MTEKRTTESATRAAFGFDGMYIDGRWVPSDGGGTDEVRSPYDGTLVAVVPRGTASDVHAAVAVAKAAFDRGPIQLSMRVNVLDRAAELLTERQETFAKAIALECAKPIKTARTEVLRAIDTFTFTAAEARTMSTSTVPVNAVSAGEGKTAYTIRTPLGVVAAIAPFNFPLNLVAHKVAPAIAVGCATVLKPATQTPVSSLLLAHLLEDAGLPAGWLNVVTGDGPEVGGTLATHPNVSYVTFTGSPVVGWGIAEASPRKRVRLELGSNAPLIVDEGSHWQEAADAAAVGGFIQAGQSCVSTQRIYVHSAVAEQFTARLAQKVAALKVGDPLDESTDVSAVISVREAERIERWIEEASEDGAMVIGGGEREAAVVTPTILVGVKSHMSVQCREIFGPVVTVVEFDDFDDALRQANDSEFGLNAGVFTNDLTRALRAVERLEFGSVYINDVPTARVDLQPYGGVKESGNTREGPHYAMEEMTELKFVTIRGTS